MAADTDGDGKVSKDELEWLLREYADGEDRSGGRNLQRLKADYPEVHTERRRNIAHTLPVNLNWDFAETLPASDDRVNLQQSRDLYYIAR